jgi:hypothetical protein
LYNAEVLARPGLFHAYFHADFQAHVSKAANQPPEALTDDHE